MTHFRKPLAAAATLNAVIFVAEGIAGLRSDSMSLMMDSVHNLSDQAALVLLYLAFVLTRGVSRNLVRSANVFNSVGLVTVSALLIWQAVERLLHPAPVLGIVPIVVGLVAALGNWGVARLLMAPARENAAIRLAYVHNLGDTYVSLAPVAAGILVLMTGTALADPLIALLTALWIVVSTLREVVVSREELLWPEKISCGHPAEPSGTDSSPVLRA